MAPRSSSSFPDRVATYAVLAGTVAAFAHLFGPLLAGTHDVLGDIGARLGVALALFAGGCAVGWIGARLGGLLSRMNDLSRQMSATAADQTSATRELHDRLEHLLDWTNTIKPRDISPLSKRPAPAPCAEAASETLPDPLPASTSAGQQASTSTQPAPSFDPGLNDRIVALLEEIREVALMNDQQRQHRLRQHLENRRKNTLDRIYNSFRTGQWAIADQLLTNLEGQFPTDGPVKQARGEFLRQRATAEADAFAAAQQRVRDLAQVSSWDPAIETAQDFVANFPANVEGRHMLTQTCRDRDAHRDAMFQRMYEIVQANVDRRAWRAALADAQKLLNEFPNHSRSNRVRQQLKAIGDNAEIEERQEHEIRIQLLVKNRRFAEAVELAEEVVRRFPDSPQADALEERLPQLRDLAEHGDGGNGA
jgi:outer membrane protein assembly factor BamD (BamD/ComL family)